MNKAKWTRAVVRVSGGRGFAAICQRKRVVVTAAHCLPQLPPIMRISASEERTYPNLIGPLNAEPSIAAECLFADPINDVAVLGCPEIGVEDGYDEFIDAAGVLPIRAPKRTRAWLSLGGPLQWKGNVWLLSLAGEWFSCPAEAALGWISVEGKTEGGMSGSPILLDDGAAVGVLCNSGNGASQPVIPDCLPRRFRPERR
jgi:hypothetical protein